MLKCVIHTFRRTATKSNKCGGETKLCDSVNVRDCRFFNQWHHVLQLGEDVGLLAATITGCVTRTLPAAVQVPANRKRLT